MDLDPYGGSTDDDEGTSPKISPRVSSIESDGGDTEDEIRRYNIFLKTVDSLIYVFTLSIVVLF